MTKQQRADKIVEALYRAFPDAMCTLDHESPERLAIRGILSAQCTDKRVNITSEELFQKYQTMADLKAADPEELASIIKPCGLTNSKTKAVLDFAGKYCDEWGNEVPRDPDKLMTCKGVGRKIANLIIGEIYGIPAIVVDTHCKRVSYRTGLSDNTDPDKVLTDLNKVIRDEDKISFGHLAVELGRTYCKAPNPQCTDCPISEFCRRRI